MKVYNSIEEFTPLNFAVVTSGTFDGVHYGHQQILRKVSKIATENNGESVIITFWPHPRLVLFPDQQDLKLLTTFEEKVQLLTDLGIDHLLKIPFTREFSELSSQEFIDQILIKILGTKKLVIGYDHRFGKNREGSFDHLVANSSRYGFQVVEIPKQEIDSVAVSSSKIRKALQEGKIPEANEYLGRPYSLEGIVIKGNMLGRKIGFPTANIEVRDEYKLIPADGIYAARITSRQKQFGGMLYIGNRPVLQQSQRSIEVNIFDFNEDIYGEIITIKMIRRIRDEGYFKSMEELGLQLAKDKEIVKQILLKE
ncbi:MAG TPA: bifunctional riboflavin kinase/FAD synthetase [Cyclobacteriaceae bacterium]|jgi:riboflavin kinase/FMN adenylyltransferase